MNLMLAQNSLQRTEDHLLVVNDQDPSAEGLNLWESFVARGCCCLCSRKADASHRALPQFAVDLDFTAQGADDSVADG